MKQLNLLKNRGKRRGLPLMSVSRFVMVVIMLLVTLQIRADEKEKEMYCVIADSVATAYFDNLYDIRGSNGAKISLIQHFSAFVEYQQTVMKVVFDASFREAKPTSTKEWFASLYKLREVIGLDNINTSNVTDMSGMFQNCSSLTNLDLSNLDTRNVTNMSGMFFGCNALTSLNINTRNVTDMSGMFSGCNALTSLNINTRNVTNMSGMFEFCGSLISLDLRNFDTSNVTSMSDMFSGCMSLLSLNLSNFDTKNVTDMSGMFHNCISLTGLDLSNFDTSNVTDMSGMFQNCCSLTCLDLSSFNTGNVKNMESMFCECAKLLRINLKNFDTNKIFCVETSLGMYWGMDYMFVACPSLEYVTIGENMIQMPLFKYCGNIKRIVSYQQEPYAIAADCFTDDVKENAQLYVPNHSRTLYKNTDGWKDFKHIVSKDLDTKVEGDSEFKKDDIDENTDFNGNIFSNIFFNIPTESGKYDSAEGCIILKKVTTDEQVKNISGLDLFDEYLLNNFTGMILMVDAGSGAIDLEAETTGEMMLNVKIGKNEPITKKLNGKSKETIEYDVTEPTQVYIYASMLQAAREQGMRRVNSQDNALKIYNIKWGKATGISNIYNETDSEATIYNLKGQRVKVPGKGLYIVNGKKVVVK